MASFWEFFFVKNPNFNFKLIQFYRYSIFLKSNTYFIRFIYYRQDFSYSKNYCSCANLETAAVIVYKRHFEKKNYKKIYLYTLRYVQ